MSVTAWGQPDGNGASSGPWNNQGGSGASHGNSSGAGSGGSARSIWGGGAPSNQGSNQWNSNMAPGANNVGRGGPVPRQSSQWGADRHNARSNQQHSNAPFNHAPGTSVRPSVGAWNSDTGPGNNHSAVPQAAAPGVNLFTQPGNNASQSSKVNPNNIWNIPGVAADSSNNSGPGGPDHPNTNTGSVRPIPSATPSVGGGQNTNAPPSNAGASNNDAQQDSFTNIGIWEPTEPKDKDPDSDPKGTRLWAAYMMQSRGSGGHNEDKTMGGKMRVPSFQSIEEMSDSEKKHLLEKLINSHEGWGKTSINQEVSWDETMNVFIPRPESISSDKTHQSDNPESPSSLNDPASFPLMVKHSSTGDNASVPLASPTSKAGNGSWGSQGNSDPLGGMRPQGGGNNGGTGGRMPPSSILPQAVPPAGTPLDDNGTSAWGTAPKAPPAGSGWGPSQGFDTASQGQQGAMTQNRPSNNSSGAPLQSPTNAWDKPLKSPVVAAPSTPSGAHGMGGSVSSVGDKTVGSNSVIGAGGPTGGSGSASGAEGAVSSSSSSGAIGGSGAADSASPWPLNAGVSLVQAITTAPASLSSSNSDVWSKNLADSGGGDSWGAPTRQMSLTSSDMWNLDDKPSLIEEIRQNPRESQQSSRVTSPSPLDVVNEALQAAQANNSSSSIVSSKHSKQTNGQMNIQSSHHNSVAAAVASSNPSMTQQSSGHVRPSSFLPSLGNFPSAESPGPLDMVPMTGLLEDQPSASGNLFGAPSRHHGNGGGMQHGGKMGQHQQLMGGLGGSSNRGSTPGGPLQQGGGSGGNGMGGRHPMNPYMLQQQQHQQQQAALNMKQQQMHHLELAFKAGLLPKNTNLNVLSICMDSQLTAQYKECLQKYAQTKFALQKLKAQLTLLRNNNHLQSQQMNPQLHRQLSEIMSNIKSYENNLSALEGICEKLNMEVSSQAMHQSQQQFSSNSNSGFLGGNGGMSGHGDFMGSGGNPGLLGSNGGQGSSGNNSGVSRLQQWINNGNSGSSHSSAALDDNVFDNIMTPGGNAGASSAFGSQPGLGSGMPFGPGGNKMSDKGSKGSFGAHEFIPGQMWTGNKDYANDPDVTPASVNTWQSAVNERDVINLQANLKQLGISSTNSGGMASGSEPSLTMKNNWNTPGSAFDINPSSDMWRQATPRMSTVASGGSGGSSNKLWNSGSFTGPAMSSGPSMGNMPGGAKWQSMRNQSLSSGAYQNFAPNLSPQRPNIAPGFGPGFRSSGGSNTPGGQSGMSGSWNYHGNIMGGGGGNGSFDPSSALALMQNFGGGGADHSDMGGN